MAAFDQGEGAALITYSLPTKLVGVFVLHLAHMYVGVHTNVHVCVGNMHGLCFAPSTYVCWCAHWCARVCVHVHVHEHMPYGRTKISLSWALIVFECIVYQVQALN